MARVSDPTRILLGYGIFKIGNVDVGLTRGGGQFTVEREYREIAADGDRGPVKDRIVIDTSRAKLKLSALEVIGDNLQKFYPGVKTTTAANKTTVTGTGAIAESDYQDEIVWIGKTKAGKEVKITIQNAVNLENIDWSLVEKDEVVAEVTYTATYSEADSDGSTGIEPWSIEYAVDGGSGE